MTTTTTLNPITIGEIDQAILNHCYQQNALIEALARIVQRTATDSEARAISHAIQALDASWTVLESTLA